MALSEEKIQFLMRGAQENWDKLEGCKLHDFKDLTPLKTFGKRFKCNNCGGEIDAQAVLWYKKGLNHAQR